LRRKGLAALAHRVALRLAERGQLQDALSEQVGTAGRTGQARAGAPDDFRPLAVQHGDHRSTGGEVALHLARHGEREDGLGLQRDQQRVGSLEEVGHALQGMPTRA
jgi:hypothetical protein